MKTRSYFEAIRSGDLPRLEQLLDEQPDLVGATAAPAYAPETQLRCTGLHAAVYSRQPAAARLLLDRGIDVEARTTEGRTALHDSIEFGVIAITDLLIDRGAEIDVCAAAILGRLERLRKLLDADPGLANDRSTGLSPLGWAAFGNRVATATELIDRGARMDDGELLCAASVGHVEVGKLLIERGADPNEVFARAGGNALHAAAAMKYSEDTRSFIHMLLEWGADVRARTRDGKTALEIAEDNARLQDERLARDPRGPQKEFEAAAALLRDFRSRNDSSVK